MRRAAEITIVDSDPSTLNLLSGIISSLGCRPKVMDRIPGPSDHPDTGGPKILFVNAQKLNGHGFEFISEIKRAPLSPEVIILAEKFDSKEAQLAIQNEAWDYFAKGDCAHEIKLSLIRALQHNSKKSSIQSRIPFKEMGLIGSCARFKSALEQSLIAARSEATVLILGETGTGKERFAKAIHINGSRSAGNFVVVDCASMPSTLVESILFGHEKGSFTGATSATQGLIEHADGGVLFLDEVGELPIRVQKSFLRVLQERTFRRIGGKSEKQSDFRLVAATNRNLEKMVIEGEFRSDLLYRINGITIEIPPLRERLEDIAEIASHHVSRLCRLYNLREKKLSKDFIQTLTAYQWPGNLRELVNALDLAIANAGDETTLFHIHLPINIRAHAVLNRRNGKGVKDIALEPEMSPNFTGRPPKFKQFLKEMQRKYLNELMCHSGGKIERACHSSGLSRSHLYKLLKETQSQQT